MSDLFHWLYVTIPFIQLLGNRFNILGFFWFATLTGLTYICLKRSDFSFGINTKGKTRLKHYFGLIAISIFTVWVFYRMLDELLTIFTVMSWDPNLLTLNPDALFFWMGKGLSYSILLIGLYYLFNTLNLKIFKMDWYSWGILIFVTVVQMWSLSIFKVDYAVLVGVERMIVFWRFYPILYLSYALLYLSLIKGKVLFNG